MDIFDYVNQTQAILSSVSGGSSQASYLASRCLPINSSKVCMYNSWHFFSLSKLSGTTDELFFPCILLDGCFWGRSLCAGSIRDACLCNHQGHAGSGRLGLGLASGLWQRRARASQRLLGQPSKTGSLLQPEKLGHIHLLCLLNLYLSSLLRLKFQICIQRFWLTCFLYEFLWIAIDFLLWFSKSYF